MSQQEKSTRRRVTSFDVAERAGVSRAAVSRAFTPNASISAETREKVVRAAKELGYRVDFLARGLIRRRSPFVGVISAGMDNPFRSLQIEKITKALVRRGLHPILLPADHVESVDHVMSQLMHYSVSGVLVTSDAPPTELCAEFSAIGIPIVLINKPDPIPGVDRIICDHDTAGRLAAETLLAGGAQHLGVVAASEVSYTAHLRQQAFLGYCRAHGVTAVCIEVRINDYANGFAASERVDELEGIFCVNDFMAFGLIDGLRRKGIRVPEDMRIIGHDDTPQAAWSGYSLTTIRQPCELQAEQAIELLEHRMGHVDAPARISITPVELIKRWSA